MRKVIFLLFPGIYILNGYLLKAEDTTKIQRIGFLFSIGPQLGVFEKLEIKDTEGNPFYYYKKIAFPCEVSMEGYWTPGTIKTTMFGGYMVKVSIIGGYFQGGGEIGQTEEEVARKNFLSGEKAHMGFVIRRKTKNRVFELSISSGILLFHPKVIVKVRDTLTGKEFYKLNYDDTFVLNQIGISARIGKRFKEKDFIPWFNFEIDYRYMWNSYYRGYNTKLMWKVFATRDKDDDNIALYLFIETLRGNLIIYTQIGAYASFGI